MYRHTNIPLKKEEVEFHFKTSFSQNLREKLKKSEIDLFRRQLIIDLKVIL